MVVGLLHDAAITGFQFAGQGSIFPKLHPPGAVAHRPDRQGRPGRHHHRPAGEAHRADRIDDDGIDGWVQDGPASCHGVTGGARWRGHDQAIALVLPHHFAIDLHLQAAGGCGFFLGGPQIEVVQRQMAELALLVVVIPAIGDAIAAVNAGLQHQPLGEGVMVVFQALP